MHDELIALHKITHPNDGVLVNGDSSLADHVEDKEDDESWEHVGPKNKSSTMRKVRFIFIYFAKLVVHW